MVELHPHDMAHGGEAVARYDGKAHFVAGAMPGEVVEASVIEDRGSWARAALVRIVEASPDRREPPCPHAASCGGCQWQFADERAQRAWKRATVVSQLEHLGRLEDPLVHDIVSPGPAFGYRNRMDFHVVEGRPALMRPRSNDPLPIDVCLLLHESLQPVFEGLGDLTGVDRLTIRSGTRTGQALAIVDGTVPDHAAAWGVPVLRRTETGLEPVHGEAALSEIVADTRFSIPPDGFFQNNTDGAEALVSLVSSAAALGSDDILLDAYCGVGLFGATAGRSAGSVLGIDAAPDAVDHARRNLAAAGISHRIIAGSVTRDIEALEAYWDVALVDPPRKGLGDRGVAAITSAMPRRVVYVSCDPASLARDARILEGFGYVFVEATPVDMFPQTFHVEIVAVFDRAGADEVPTSATSPPAALDASPRTPPRR
jgi:23S rRNA (uracil1939-C5)-methyltransferase